MPVHIFSVSACMTGCNVFKWLGKDTRLLILNVPHPSPIPLPPPLYYSPIWQCFWASSTDTTHPNLQFPGSQKLWLIFLFFFYFAWFHDFFACTYNCSVWTTTTKKSYSGPQLFWANSLSTLDVFRWDLRLQDPRAECSLRSSGPGQVHWRGGHPGQGQAWLWAAERAHLHHPSLWLWRGSWWRQHEEVPQVSQFMFIQWIQKGYVSLMFSHSLMLSHSNICLFFIEK